MRNFSLLCCKLADHNPTGQNTQKHSQKLWAWENGSSTSASKPMPLGDEIALGYELWPCPCYFLSCGQSNWSVILGRSTSYNVQLPFGKLMADLMLWTWPLQNPYNPFLQTQVRAPKLIPCLTQVASIGFVYYQFLLDLVLLSLHGTIQPLPMPIRDGQHQHNVLFLLGRPGGGWLPQHKPTSSDKFWIIFE